MKLAYCKTVTETGGVWKERGLVEYLPLTIHKLNI